MSAVPQLDPEKKQFYERNGYLIIGDIISAGELERYRGIYDQFLNGTIDTGKNRSDLGAGLGDNRNVENITQIMWPSDFVPALLGMTYHTMALQMARALEGEDMEMDFDMMINKAPHTGTITPWHQDAAYWINMPDKRAVSCWLALDEATLENGCMWYIPGSHLLPLRNHRGAGAAGGALLCEGSEAEGVAIPLQPGSCVMHHGATVHYSRGNDTDHQRRALIINFRPAEMIAMERRKGFDHGRGGNAADRKVRNEDVNTL
jgi:phytanoyl-CoA hydroxylase